MYTILIKIYSRKTTSPFYAFGARTLQVRYLLHYLSSSIPTIAGIDIIMTYAYYNVLITSISIQITRTL